jgi:hypothetical protein
MALTSGPNSFTACRLTTDAVFYLIRTFASAITGTELLWLARSATSEHCGRANRTGQGQCLCNAGLTSVRKSGLQTRQPATRLAGQRVGISTFSHSPAIEAFADVSRLASCLRFRGSRSSAC